MDAIIEETEKRFEEARQRIDEQFEQAEQEAVVPEPMEGEAEVGIDIDTSLDEEPLSGEAMGDAEVDAFLEEQERRFEAAQRELEQQFEAMEQEVPEFGDDSATPWEEPAVPGEEAMPEE